ncbi:hypothetical protein D3C81_2017390 [compost metagenome]
MRRLRFTNTAGSYQQEDARRCTVVSEARSGGAQPLCKCNQRRVLTNNTLGQLIFQVQQAGVFVFEQAPKGHTGPVSNHLTHTAGANVE